MLFACMSDKGKKREKNEDSVYAADGLFVVADGMGGHSAGEIASSMATKIISDCLSDVKDNFREAITDAVACANSKIYAAAEGELSGMGTTVDVCIYDGKYIHIGHVGDSRVYIIKNGMLNQITVDHSYVEMLLQKGEITKAEAKNYPMKNMITRAVGVSDGISTDYYETAFGENDVLLMCTDGLTNAVSEEQILEIVKGEKELSEAAKKLVNAANENGGPDNITVIIARCA